MNRPDDEFDDFLARRKPLFGRASEDPLEPPEEVDRLILRQARDAIQPARPQRVYLGSRWGAPLGIAATLVLALTVILHDGTPAKKQPVPEVTVQTVAQRIDSTPMAPAAIAHAPAPASAPAPGPGPAAAEAANNTANARVASGARVETGGFVSDAEADRYANATSANDQAAPAMGVVVEVGPNGSQTVVTNVSPPPTEAQRALVKANPDPAFRGDSRRWLAEIDRLRAEGKAAQADAELAEYKRLHRAYAVSPDK